MFSHNSHLELSMKKDMLQVIKIVLYFNFFVLFSCWNFFFFGLFRVFWIQNFIFYFFETFNLLLLYFKFFSPLATSLFQTVYSIDIHIYIFSSANKLDLKFHLGGYISSSENSIGRFALLAVGFGSGVVGIYSIPFIEQLHEWYLITFPTWVLFLDVTYVKFCVFPTLQYQLESNSNRSKKAFTRANAFFIVL